MITQMRVKGLIFDPYNNAYIVVLRDEENSDMLPIWVGKSEASGQKIKIKIETNTFHLMFFGNNFNETNNQLPTNNNIGNNK